MRSTVRVQYGCLQGGVSVYIHNTHPSLLDLSYLCNVHSYRKECLYTQCHTPLCEIRHMYTVRTLAPCIYSVYATGMGMTLCIQTPLPVRFTIQNSVCSYREGWLCACLLLHELLAEKMQPPSLQARLCEPNAPLPVR